MKTTSLPPDVPRRVLVFLDRELKGPITNILALSQTLTAGRVSRVAVREYASMTSLEARRMMRLLEEMAALLRAGAVRDACPPLSTERRVRTITKRNRVRPKLK